MVLTVDKKTLREFKRFYKWELSPNLTKRQKCDLRYSIFSYRMERDSLGDESAVSSFSGLEGYRKRESISGDELEILEALISKDLWGHDPELMDTMETGDELEWLMDYYKMKLSTNLTSEEKEALSERIMDYIYSDLPSPGYHSVSEFPDLARYWPKKHISLRNLITIESWLSGNVLDDYLEDEEE